MSTYNKIMPFRQLFFNTTLHLVTQRWYQARVLNWCFNRILHELANELVLIAGTQQKMQIISFFKNGIKINFHLVGKVELESVLAPPLNIDEVF